ncbi:MAG: trypsin-like peptidase domain-containing protein [Lentisphaeria bacterium]|nr:trypsin-like peptidase domain-containing protein [Lentisphaeria bacterium]
MRRRGTAGWVAALLCLGAVAPRAADDFRQMSPTVRVISYKRTRTDRIVPAGSGSGTVITRDGHVLTNHHVIFDDNDMRPFDGFEIDISFDMRREPARRTTARLVAHDKSLDLALLRLNPADVLGTPLPALRCHDWRASFTLREGQSIQVLGYPASGGETLTVTRGQISGFDKLNEYACFKTDTDIDHGSSGGTVLGSKGVLIGVPVFLRTYAENVGYVLDIREARPWIGAHLGGEAFSDAVAEARLVHELAWYNRANSERLLRTEIYPRLEAPLPPSWELEELGEDGFLVAQQAVADPAAVGVHFDRRPFPIDAGFKDEMAKEHQSNRSRFPDFEREETLFCGAEAWRVSFTSVEDRHVLWHVFVGNTMITLSYVLEDGASQAQKQAIGELLDGIRLLDGADSRPPEPRRQFTFTRPPAAIALPEGWGGRDNPGSEPYEQLLTIWQKGNCEGVAQLSCRRVPKEQAAKPAGDRLREHIRACYGERVLRKEADLRVDGLPGWFCITETETEIPGEVRRLLTAVLIQEEFEFVFEYIDAPPAFTENGEDMRAILASLRFGDADRPGRGDTHIGIFRTRFADIQHHRFAEAIASLASRDLLHACPDDRFEPEEPVTRARALRWVVDSWNRLQEDRTPAAGIALDAPDAATPSFADIPAGDPLEPYAAAARQHGWLPGPVADRFAPEGPVALVDALTLIFAVYGIPTWQGRVDPPWKPVLDKGYELDILPRGLEEPGRRLTNAEMAALVDATLRIRE